MLSQSEFKSFPVSTPHVASLILILLIGICPFAMGGLAQRDFLEQTVDDGANDYLQESYLDKNYGQTESGVPFRDEAAPSLYDNAEGADFTEARSGAKGKRERCYCDLDLFCKRFGCRRKRGHLSGQGKRDVDPISRKAKILLELARRVNAEMSRRVPS